MKQSEEMEVSGGVDQILLAGWDSEFGNIPPERTVTFPGVARSLVFRSDHRHLKKQRKRVNKNKNKYKMKLPKHSWDGCGGRGAKLCTQTSNILKFYIFIVNPKFFLSPILCPFDP